MVLQAGGLFIYGELALFDHRFDMTLDVGNIQQELQKVKEHLSHLEALLTHSEGTAQIPEIMTQARAAIASYEVSLGEKPGSIYKEKTFARAQAVLGKLMVMVGTAASTLGVPKLYAGTGGDLDINWKNVKFEVLLTVPENPNEPIYYSMDNFAKIKTKGTIPDDKLDTFALILQGFL